MITHSETPLNAEPSASELVKADITPIDLLYHRNHGPIPQDAQQAVNDSSKQDENSWDISLELEAGALGNAQASSQQLKLADIKGSFPYIRESIALQCAGNRRSKFEEGDAGVSTQGVAWQEGTIANISWGGCLLKSVLEKHLEQFSSSKKSFHIIFESSQDCGEEEGGVFGGSIEGKLLLEEDIPVMLSWDHNGEPLTLEHGAPLRVVVPGVIGARSVKWLKRITISSQPSQHHAQQYDYKALPMDPNEKKPSSEAKQEWMEHVSALSFSPLQSVVVEAKASKGLLKVEGYSLGRRGVPVSRIEIAIVEQPGSTGTNNNSEEALTLAAKNQDVWQTVQLSGAADLQRRWDWQLWDFTCPIDTQKGGKPKFVVARAVDAEGTQQERWPDWNLRGVQFDGWSVQEITENA